MMKIVFSRDIEFCDAVGLLATKYQINLHLYPEEG